ncbi:MAG: AAA family ATPase, partial [Candidatus Binataceae bacterium]
MRLKSLDLVGFKSFLEPTVISFAPGITAVAGPNGCGKSNVMDAIRWVLGEQAATRLRGKSAEDLIYAGNENNPAAGMAEVSLTLEAGETTALPEPYSSLSEICITRRAYRSGESEYLLNKLQCRLKDITEFFMAAGIHSRGYALVEQGRVGEIIQAKPLELRNLIEEAAGLGLFKGRREMSERKLERVRENLSRVSDVLAEIERQLSYSRRQAKKAEAYRIIRAELVELERLAAARRLIGVRAQLALASERETELRVQSGNARSETGALELSSNEALAAVSAARDRLSSVSRELDGLRASSADRARARDFLKLRLGAINDEAPAAMARLRELEAKAAESRAARAAAAAHLAREMRIDNGGDETGLEQLNARNNAARAALRESERHTENLKDELSEIIREAAVIRGRLADLSGERAELEERLAGAGSADSSASELENSRNDLRAVQDELERLKSELLELEAAHGATAERELESGAVASRFAAQLQSARESLKRAERRAAIHRERPVAVRLRGVLDSLNGDRPALEPPSLIDVIKAPAPMETALKAVLGDQLEAVIVDSPHFAARAIEILKEQEAGRLSFVPEASDSAVTPAIEAQGIAGRLIDMLEFEPRFAATAEALLGHVMVAEDVPSALAASNLNGHGTIFVTRDGDLVWPGRLISGGSANHSDAALGNEPQLSVADAQALAEAAEREHEEAGRQLSELRGARGDIDRRIADSRRQIGNAEKNLDQKRRALATIESRIALAEARRVDARRRLIEIGEAAAAGNARLEELARGEQASRAALASVSGEAAARKITAEELGRAVIEASARVEARRATLRGLEQDLSHLRHIAAEFESQIDALHAALERSSIERAEFERELSQLAAQERENREREEILAQAMEASAAECGHLEDELTELRGALLTAREHLSR